jgi:hypothetical protein
MTGWESSGNLREHSWRRSELKEIVKGQSRKVELGPTAPDLEDLMRDGLRMRSNAFQETKMIAMVGSAKSRNKMKEL